MARTTGRDRILIEDFLRGYNQHIGETYQPATRPDEVERQKQAVDWIAKNCLGRILANEHTLIQPFIGEKDDAQRLMTVIAPLEADHSLRIPGKSLDVFVGVGAIPRGPDWKLVGPTVIAWFRDARLTVPEGQSVHSVPDVGFDLTLHIEKDDSPYPEGRVCVSRSDIPDDFQLVVRKALEDKLPKLAGTRADKRILLFEKDNLPRGYTEIGKVIESLKGEFPDLAKVDEVWVVNTVARVSEGCLFFLRVWPGGVTAKFQVNGRSS
jgi:hypothetical protein